MIIFEDFKTWETKNFKTKWDKLEFFLDDVQELSWSIEEKYNADLKISYDESTESIILSYIGVPEHLKGQGIAHKMMIDLCQYADHYGLNIRLYASGDLGSDIKRLMKFYTQFGFVDQNKFIKDVGRLMIRIPKI